MVTFRREIRLWSETGVTQRALMIRDDADTYWLACQMQHSRITAPDPAIISDPRSSLIQPRRPGPGLLVDDRGHAQVGQQPPRRGHRPEVQVPGPPGQHRLLAGVQQRLHLRRGAHVPLGDHLGLAVHPAHLAQVPVRLAADHLLVQARHEFRS